MYNYSVYIYYLEVGRHLMRRRKEEEEERKEKRRRKRLQTARKRKRTVSNTYTSYQANTRYAS